MSILFMEGFDAFSAVADLRLSYPNAHTGTAVVDTTAFARGRGIRTTAAQTGYCSAVFPAIPLGTPFGVSARARWEAAPTGENRRAIASFYDTLGTLQVQLFVTQDLGLAVYRGTSLLRVAFDVLRLNTWEHVEMKASVNTAGGVVEVRVNGTTVIYVEGETRNGGSGLVSSVRFANNTNSSAGTASYDDFVIWDGAGPTNNDWVGDLEVQALVPNADGSITGWTPNTGTAWGAISEAAANGDTTYISASTVGAEATFDVNNLAGTPAKVMAVQVGALTRKDDTGALSLQIGVESDTEEDLSAVLALATTYGQVTHAVNLDPNTDAPWDVSGVNSVRLKVKVAG